MGKKISLLLLLLLFFLIGCDNMMNTPTHRVESFYHKYQNLDKEIIKQLDLIISKEEKLDKKMKSEYKAILERQYENLSYKITKEEIDNNKAFVDTEIEVLDYKHTIKKIEEEYQKKNNKISNKKYQNNKIKELKQVNDKVKYNITFYLEKNNGIWQIKELSKEDREKIHGLY